MTEITVGLAQCQSHRGDIRANLDVHIAWVTLASHHRVDLLVFPELSLTGYEPELAESLALEPTDSRLQPLLDAARQFGMTIVAGAPIVNGSEKPRLGALVFSPAGVGIYCKQHLHPGEERYFSPGDSGCCIEVGGVQIGLAICADTSHASHAAEAAARGAEVYLAGVLFTEKGYAADEAMLRGYAVKHRMAVGIANHCVPTGGYTPAGRSAIWDERGESIAAAAGAESALVIARCVDRTWHGELVPFGSC